MAGLLLLAAAAGAGATGRRMLIAFEPGAGATERAKALKAVGTTAVEDLGGLDAVVAEVPDAGLGVSALESSILASPWVRAVEEDVYVKWLSAAEAGLERPAWPTMGEVRAALPRFKKSDVPAPPAVDSAELPWGIARVNAPAAWSVTQGEGVRVAVIDTGIDASHPDLKDRVAGGYNAFNKNGSYFDDNSHGTHVSGTIAAS